MDTVIKTVVNRRTFTKFNIQSAYCLIFFHKDLIKNNIFVFCRNSFTPVINCPTFVVSEPKKCPLFWGIYLGQSTVRHAGAILLTWKWARPGFATQWIFIKRKQSINVHGNNIKCCITLFVNFSFQHTWRSSYWLADITVSFTFLCDLEFPQYNPIRFTANRSIRFATTFNLTTL